MEHKLTFPQHYETEYKPSLHADPKEDPESADFAQKNFRPLYYTLQYPEDKSKIEMSFGIIIHALFLNTECSYIF